MPDTFVGDFSQVKERNFNTKHLPEGEYRAKIVKVDDHKASSGNANWLYSIAITETRGRGAIYPLYCGLATDQLWKLRNLYAACGITIPKKKMRLKRDALQGKELGIVLEDDEYEGKPKSVIAATIPLDEISSNGDVEAADDDEEEEDEVEEAPAAKGKKSKKGKKAKPAPADDDELEELEIEEL